MITLHFHLQPQYKYELFHINFTSPIKVFQSHPFGCLKIIGPVFAEVTGSNPVEALIFSGFFFLIAYIGKFTAMITLDFHLQPQYKYELFHINFTSPIKVFQSPPFECLKIFGAPSISSSPPILDELSLRLLGFFYLFVRLSFFSFSFLFLAVIS